MDNTQTTTPKTSDKRRNIEAALALGFVILLLAIVGYGAFLLVGASGTAALFAMFFSGLSFTFLGFHRKSEGKDKFSLLVGILGLILAAILIGTSLVTFSI